MAIGAATITGAGLGGALGAGGGVGALASIFGGAGGGGGFFGNLLGGGLGFLGAKDLAEEATDAAKFVLKNRYTLAQRDLERAGFNPLLALGGPGGGISTGGSPSGPIANMPAGLAQLGTSAVQAANLREDIKLKKDLRDKTKAETNLAQATQKRMGTLATKDISEAGLANTSSVLAAARSGRTHIELRVEGLFLQYLEENPEAAKLMFEGRVSPNAMAALMQRLITRYTQEYGPERTGFDALRDTVREYLDSFQGSNEQRGSNPRTSKIK